MSKIQSVTKKKLYDTGEYLQKLHTRKPEKRYPNWLYSEKLDGMMAFWDGGISRGLPQDQCSWSNRYKNERYKNEPLCTGLWSRYGNVIVAPDWWLDMLPRLLVIGELYVPQAEGKSRQDIMSVVKTQDGSSDWTDVMFFITERVPSIVFNQLRSIRLGVGAYWNLAPDLDPTFLEVDRSGLGIFQSDQKVLTLLSETWPSRIRLTPQLPFVNLAEVLERGGEGIVIRDPMGTYTNKRTDSVLKEKECKDAEGEIIGYTDGKNGFEGLVGALVIKTDTCRLDPRLAARVEDIVFELSSGLTLADRANPPPKGATVTFKFRCLTNDHKPQEARYVGIRAVNT